MHDNRNFLKLHRDEIDEVDHCTSDHKSFENKTKMIGERPERQPQPENTGGTDQPPQSQVLYLNVQFTTPLKYLSNFCRFLNLPSTNCEVQRDLSRTKYWVLTEHHQNVTGVAPKITSTKFFVPVFTLSIKNNTHFYKTQSMNFKNIYHLEQI